MNIILEIGFRFLPPDEQIISFFLKKKMIGDHDRTRHIREIDLLKHVPWDLPAMAIVTSTYPEWLFFYKLNKISEKRNDRLTKDGFWKSTGSDRGISCEGGVIGFKKTLVFYKGRTPHAVKTDWVMHEFRAAADFIPPNADNSYVVGYLRNNATVNIENSTSNHGQPRTPFAAPSSQNNPVGVTSMEVGPQLQFNNMDYELALQAQMEDQGIYHFDLPPSNVLLDLPSSSATTNNDQIMIDGEGLTLEDLDFLASDDVVDEEQYEWQIQSDDLVDEEQYDWQLQSDDLVDEEQYEWQLQFDTESTFEEERALMASLSRGQDEGPSVGAGQLLRSDYRAPDYAGDSRDADPELANALFDQIVLTSDGTGHGHSEGFNQRRMENGVHHDEILIMDSSVESATVTTCEINCLESVKEERSVNSRACKSRYEPKSHKSVVQGHPRRVQLQGESLRKAVSGDNTRESGVRGPVVELVPSKKSIVQPYKGRKIDRGRNSKSGLNSRSNGSAGSSRKTSFNFVEMSELSCKPNPPLVYVVKVLLGVILFIVVVREVMFIR